MQHLWLRLRRMLAIYRMTARLRHIDSLVHDLLRTAAEDTAMAAALRLERDDLVARLNGALETPAPGSASQATGARQ